MKLKRFTTLLMLLFAVWMPLDNALASAVIEGCPMMTPAFSQGWQALWGQAPEVAGCPNHSSGMMTATVSSSAPQLMTYHCADEGCTHCSWCLLLGSPALPVSMILPPAPVYAGDHLRAVNHPAPLARASVPFRPPIV